MGRLILAGSVVLALTAAGLAEDFVDGQITKIDKAQGKITLRHGPIKALDMDAMTMVFRVQDPKVLDTLKVGDRVRFTAARVEGQITVTSIRKAR
jgi:Cu/Ag efflux protein CusF